jgi:hypothetical protein
MAVFLNFSNNTVSIIISEVSAVTEFPGSTGIYTKGGHLHIVQESKAEVMQMIADKCVTPARRFS